MKMSDGTKNYTNDWQWWVPISERYYGGTQVIPHKCPICQGRGTMPADFYEMSDPTAINTCPVPCKSCQGKGVIFA